MRFPPQVWVEVLQFILEGHQEYLETLSADQEDDRLSIIHEIEVLEDILERTYLLERFVILQIH